jgi:phospholipase C
MKPSDRRTFLKLIGSPVLAAGLPGIERALAIPANQVTGTIADVEHIIILMQENRSFDHYFGVLRGVRGFGDPRAVRLPSGQAVWRQPAGSGYLMPFRPDVESLGMEFLPDPPHGWNDTHAAWNAGRHDGWVPNKGVTSMTYHRRHDIPYHYALADAFTICDAYHCSLMGPTDPNRYHLWSGWVGNDGTKGGPVITNAQVGYGWSTYPERLERAGISWKIYQDIGVGLDDAGNWGWTSDPYIGNYGDNALLYFNHYQHAEPGNPLSDRAKTGTEIRANREDPVRLMDIFAEDVREGRLPQVSWIVAPEAYSEHPNWRPNYGAWYVSQFIDILTSYPDVWSKTVLFVNYDEEGGFFDHMVPPTPPPSRDHGLSTVPTTYEIYPGDLVHPRGPYGLGMRVPMLVISPWSKGGWVNSQVFDHTSIIRFLEARFANGNPDLIETNITAWRRAVTGDLTSAFDFENPDGWRDLDLPSTDAFFPEDFERHPDDVPVPPLHQALPDQEPGVRPARALPYELHAHGGVASPFGGFRITFTNTGRAAAVFQVRAGHPWQSPRNYTIEPQKMRIDSWSVSALGAFEYDLSVHGPNGFLRAFKGGIPLLGRAQLDVRASYDESRTGITLSIANLAPRAAHVSILDRYSRERVELALEPGENTSRHWSLTRFSGWYDLVITVVGDAGFEYHFAGHLENGEDSISDPILGVPR